MTRLGLALLLASLGTGAFAETRYLPWPEDGAAPRPYIFTQQHNVENRPDAEGRVQLIRKGYPLQVQLPGNPAIWSFRAGESENVAYRGRTMVYSPNRIAGTESLLVFDLELSPEVRDGDEGRITFTTDQLPSALERVVPGGVFVLRFTVIDPG